MLREEISSLSREFQDIKLLSKQWRFRTLIITGLIFFLAVSCLLALAVIFEGLDDDQIKSLSTIFSGVVFIVAAGWAVATYTNNKRLEFRRYFVEQQVAIALETAKTAGNLVDCSGANDNETKEEWNKTKGRFWELYWGRLVLFEDEGVIEAMIDLGDKLNDTPFEKRSNLRSEAYAVSTALRTFLETKNAHDWRITFADIRPYESAKRNIEPLPKKNSGS